jgi:hypothetical protein
MDFLTEAHGVVDLKITLFQFAMLLLQYHLSEAMKILQHSQQMTFRSQRILKLFSGRLRK